MMYKGCPVFCYVFTCDNINLMTSHFHSHFIWCNLYPKSFDCQKLKLFRPLSGSSYSSYIYIYIYIFPEFESHDWIYLRTPGDISWGFSGKQASLGTFLSYNVPSKPVDFFLGELWKSPAVFMVTKTSYCSWEVGPSPPMNVTTKTDI